MHPSLPPLGLRGGFGLSGGTRETGDTRGRQERGKRNLAQADAFAANPDPYTQHPQILDPNSNPQTVLAADAASRAAAAPKPATAGVHP